MGESNTGDDIITLQDQESAMKDANTITHGSLIFTGAACCIMSCSKLRNLGGWAIFTILPVAAILYMFLQMGLSPLALSAIRISGFVMCILGGCFSLAYIVARTNVDREAAPHQVGNGDGKGKSFVGNQYCCAVVRIFDGVCGATTTKRNSDLSPQQNLGESPNSPKSFEDSNWEAGVEEPADVEVPADIERGMADGNASTPETSEMEVTFQNSLTESSSQSSRRRGVLPQSKSTYRGSRIKTRILKARELEDSENSASRLLC